jgi:predicted amidophosphoribosyltransferase
MLDTNFNYCIPGLISLKHLVYYVPGYNDVTAISRAIIDFKENRHPYVDFWCDIICKEMISEKGFYDAIIRPLSSKETNILVENSLDTLGKKLSVAIDSPYIGQFFIKDEQVSAMHKIRSQAERYKTLSDHYDLKYLINPNKISNAKLLLIDDVATSGSTTRVICELLLKNYKDIKVSLLTIGRTSPNPQANVGFLEIHEKLNKLNYQR